MKYMADCKTLAYMNVLITKVFKHYFNYMVQDIFNKQDYKVAIYSTSMRKQNHFIVKTK